MALTDPKIKALKYSPKGKKSYSDGGGLNIVLKPTGVKVWQYITTMQRKPIKFTIGKYPEISIKRARQIHQEARELVAQGVHPKILKEKAKADKELNEKRFSDFCMVWIKKQGYKSSTESDLIQRIEKNLSPFLDRKPVNEWNTRELLGVLDRMVQRGAIETARRLAGTLKNVYNDIFLLGIVDINPAQGLQELLPQKPKPKNFGAITNVDDLKDLFLSMQEIRPREDYAVTQALRFIPLVFLRPYNVRYLRWEYVDIDSNQISIPAEEMKRDKPHIVPLSRQAKDLLLDMAELTGGNEFVFSTSRGRGKPLSENTTTAAFKRRKNPKTGKPYGTGAITSHGFRHTASTLLNEMGFNADLIEVQLSHLNKDTVRATYNKAEYLPQRAEMMQAWADYLEALQSKGSVIPIHRVMVS
ncbi:tyrosine-type recombinase/integrase [Thiomicrorhabdus sp. 6S2-11]|uniref:Tyrosine-type recombinase/integrase n=1 Tax=Thiomicrorhabdus marina TaxID=2818442 RepID=A0ABS3Q6A2_9GAMM|nr:tyrosine-type recombinase/integrase [Thiomicrorhabdus marina]MBO1927881.1 tyrosine-type recombinase/integrase [Thiomicrorhabdus marina]